MKIKKINRYSKIYKNVKDIQSYCQDFDNMIEFHKNKLKNDEEKKALDKYKINPIDFVKHKSLLDSSLILATKSINYNVKIIDCGDYCQLYKVPITRKKSNEIEKEYFSKNLIINNTDNLIKKENYQNNYVANIDKKNIMRSKLQCQRYAKANSKYWKTFITLTFEENITDINLANTKFRNFIDSTKRDFKDLMYICIPEFQKRGAVHYHLLTNISLDNDLIYSQIDNEKFKHIKHWNYGFTKVDSLNDDIKKIVGYISKYMTKDIDNRLFNRHRYFVSRNLKKPTITYLDTTDKKQQNLLIKKLSDKKLIFENSYIDYKNNEILFQEYLTTN